MSFLEWIGLDRSPSFHKALRLGTLVGILLGLLVLAIVVGGLAILYQFLGLVLQSKSDHEAIRNIGLALVAVLGAPFIVWRATVAQKQADTAEQSHITDQINKAVAGLGTEKTVDRLGRPVQVFYGKAKEITVMVNDPDTFTLRPRSLEIKRYHDLTQVDVDDVFDGLHIDVKTWSDERTEIDWQRKPLEVEVGAVAAKHGEWTVFSETEPNIEVRIGAIYALERISQDSPRDHIRIMEILCAYIRENAPAQHLKPSEDGSPPPAPRSDIQTALDVVGRRTANQIELEDSARFRLDLRGADLSGAHLVSAKFAGAIMIGCRLEATDFRRADLRAARLDASLLNFAVFLDSNLLGATIDYSILNATSLSHPSFNFAKETRGLSMMGADISGIRFLNTRPSHIPTLASHDTKLHDRVAAKLTKHEKDISEFSDLVFGLKVDDESSLRERLTEGGFLYWSDLSSDDGAIFEFRERMRKELGLTGFPYDNTEDP